MAKTFKQLFKPTFKATVEIPVIGGDPIRTGFTFKALNRKDLARMYDKWKVEATELRDEAHELAEGGSPMTLEEWTEKEIALQVKQLKDIVEGWGFDEEFTDENIERLVMAAVSITDVIIEQYHEAFKRASSGN